MNPKKRRAADMAHDPFARSRQMRKAMDTVCLDRTFTDIVKRRDGSRFFLQHHHGVRVELSLRASVRGPVFQIIWLADAREPVDG